MSDTPRTIDERIQEYLELGGLFNPELMNPAEAVRDIIIDCRKQLSAAQSENARLREELLDYSAVADSDKYWHGKYTALTAAVNALLAAAMQWIIGKVEHENIAPYAYDIADAMLAALEVHNE